MKLLALCLAVALLTFIAGITTPALLLNGPESPTLSQLEPVVSSESQTRPTQSSEASTDESAPYDALFIKGDRLSYAGYDVERWADPATHESFAAIKRNGKTLLKFSDAHPGIDSTEIGLFPFLGGDTKQLIIMQYTGGGHCCWINKIYELTPRLRVLYDDESYGLDHVGYELVPKDLDGDGRYEFTRAVMIFDYFHMSHASSVFPIAVFAYDEKKREYLPANRKFSEYNLEGIEDDIKRAEESRELADFNAPQNEGYFSQNEEYLSAVLSVVSKYIYAGREADGWEFFDRVYQLRDKQEIRKDAKKALRGDPIYQSIYR